MREGEYDMRKGSRERSDGGHGLSVTPLRNSREPQNQVKGNSSPSVERTYTSTDSLNIYQPWREFNSNGSGDNAVCALIIVGFW